MSTKTMIDEILEQPYLSAYDLQKIIPTMTYANALAYIERIRLKMKEKNLYVPPGKTKLALTKLIRKECGF